jgi:hypothetical protein
MPVNAHANRMKMNFTPGPRNDGQSRLGTTEKGPNLAPWQHRRRRSLTVGGAGVYSIQIKFKPGLVHYRNATLTDHLFFKRLGNAAGTGADYR